ncbi:MAG: magnesium transporter CorA family protein [Candidatus Saccharimonadales bacterium]|nr:magnesium transporter CorA family protein [Candidatus Saccharimonadales bacterium]
MIRYYHKTLKSKAMKASDKYKVGSWVYVENPTEAELEELIAKFNLDAGHLADALDVDEVPRIEHEDDQMYMFTRFPYTDNDLQIDTSTLLFVLHPDCLITVVTQPLPRLDKIVSGKLGVNTTQKVKVMLQILEQIDDMFETYTSNIAKQIRGIRTRLRHEQVNNRDFVDFVVIEDALNDFLSAQIPMNAILRRLMLGKQVRLYEEDRELLEDLQLNNEQSVEAARSSIKTITNIREAYSTIMSNNLNRVIRILTVATVVLSVPTLVASIYGMNLELPFADSPVAFAGVVVGSFVLAAAMLVYFRFKRWL